jgi:hypothetical protein
MRSLRIVVEPYASNHLKQVVEDGLGLYNVAVTGFAEYYPVAIFLKDENSAILGGVLGHLWGKWLRVAILWLAELARRQGRSRSKGCRLTLHSAGPMRTCQRGQVSGDKGAEDKRSSYVLCWYVHEKRRGQRCSGEPCGGNGEVVCSIASGIRHARCRQTISFAHSLRSSA